MTKHTNFIARLTETAQIVHGELDNLLKSKSAPDQLVNAMRHGLLNGGKRVRPFLVLETAHLFGISSRQAMRTACALECLHSYSLIHDDLPAMDNDELRRGEPTVHIAYDDATAILAGDALLTLAFELLATDDQTDASTKSELIALLSKAAGWEGMIGGQILDIAAENQVLNEIEIKTLQAMKTGALIRFACEAGAVLGKASNEQRTALISYGEAIGLAFQLADDLLDITADSADLGKTAGKDIQQGKGTLVSIYGAEKTRSLLADIVSNAETSLSSFGSQADTLRHTAQFISERKN